ncbi:MAG: NUDIX domain-containing protein [Candidatus Pacebacteria bacterium]|nr:NUDIX domain-containing protein [Candidatus Paceibacterota bacterium]
MKKTIYSVTNFLHCGNDYLFIHRTKKVNKVDGGRLNGIGGKLEKGENFLAAAIRETAEETGYVVTAENIKLVGVVRMQGGYMDNWMMNFFKISVPTKEIPLGNENAEGELIWLPADQVLTSGYELVDDLNYCFKDIVKNNIPFFAHAQMTKEEKVKTWNIGYLK